MMNTFNMHGHSKMVYVCGRSWELVNSSENTLEQIAFGGNWSKHIRANWRELVKFAEST